MSKETVIFDLGAVLIDWNPRYLYRKIFPTSDEVEYFLTEICPQSWNEKQDAGYPFAAAIAERMTLFPKYREAIAAYFTRWPEMLGGEIAGTVEILREVRARKLRTYALTNWSAETFPHALERFSFLREFDGVVVSGNEKMKKPDPRFFRLLFDRYGVNPARAIFIDDVPHNIAGAREVGLDGILFQSPKQLREDLRNLGIL